MMLGSDKFNLKSHWFDSAGNGTPQLLREKPSLYQFDHHAQSLFSSTGHGSWIGGVQEFDSQLSQANDLKIDTRCFLARRLSL